MTDTADAGGERADGMSFGGRLLHQATVAPHREAFRHPDGDRWASLSWLQTKDVTFELAAGLVALGVEPEHRVAIASNTRIEWVLADLGVMCAGAATTTVYPTTKPEDVGYILSDSESRVLFAEDVGQVEKVLDRAAELPHLGTIVLMEGELPESMSGDERVITWEQLKEKGRSWLSEHPDGIEQILSEITPDKLATLIYTSGTTGRPKGVRLVHDCWLYEGDSVAEVDILSPDDLQYLWLPLSHVFGKALLAIQMKIGFASAVDGRIDKIVDGLGEVKPTFMAGAPRIFEKVRAKVMMREKSAIAAKIFDWAFQVGRSTIEPRLANKPLTGLDKVKYGIARKLVFSKLEETMGGRVRFFISGSAALAREVQEWFFSAGLLILEGYGLTESSAAIFVNLPDGRTKFGTVGPPLPGTQVRIADDGEILVKGRAVMEGYHNQPDATAEVLEDGWFHTGDIGQLDADNYLRITDRKKDLIKTSGGKYVAPQKVTGVMKAASPYLSEVIIAGEHHKYIVALLTLDAEAIQGWAEANELGHLSYADLTQHEKVRAMIDEHIQAGNAQLERWETIKRFTILDSDLSVDEGEVTPSMKVRRRTVIARNQAILDSMYQDEND
ncbi:MAG TPA: long-chain fatty acid--CoA ligase [Candidatus Avipropionibacterium avicola]|uniref:Acyl-CoA synthetase n=1 Tax=Candidatus Avipropionibacterium avicola TaxID=2840701 RepID=A0A9D1H0Y6_9ACTN|nr:long-chain fatty acid--CoA ligase [Candidatus Avipropionibacterium avicola]